MPTTHSQAQQLTFDYLIIKNTTPASTTFSAPNRGILDQESRYLCAWLRSRLEDGTWTLREESALTATAHDKAQVTRLAHKARALGLSVWTRRAGRAA